MEKTNQLLRLKGKEIVKKAREKNIYYNITKKLLEKYKPSLDKLEVEEYEKPEEEKIFCK